MPGCQMALPLGKVARYDITILPYRKDMKNLTNLIYIEKYMSLTKVSDMNTLVDSL